jgi:hypothetical protein
MHIIGIIIGVVFVAAIIAKIFKLTLTQGIVATVILAVITIGVGIYYLEKSSREENRRQQQAWENELNSGQAFVGQWDFKSGSDNLNIVQTTYGKLLVSRTNYSDEAIWTVPGYIENYQVVFEGKSKGRKYSGRLSLQDGDSSFKQQMAGELNENGEVSAIVVERWTK